MEHNFKFINQKRRDKNEIYPKNKILEEGIQKKLRKQKDIVKSKPKPTIHKQKQKQKHKDIR